MRRTLYSFKGVERKKNQKMLLFNCCKPFILLEKKKFPADEAFNQNSASKGILKALMLKMFHPFASQQELH